MRAAHSNPVALFVITAGLAGCGGGGAALVEPPPPVFTSVVIAPDSITIAVGTLIPMAATARDQNGTAISPLPPVIWTIEDTTVASVTGLAVMGQTVGSTRVFASVTDGSVTHADTARVVVTAAPAGAPTHPVNTPGTSFAPASITVAVGDTVTWVFGGATHNVTFALPSPPGGDIPDQAPPAQVIRVFATAGLYTYECTRHANMRGTVIVQSGQTQRFTSVSLTPATVTLQIGGTVQLVATPLDQSGVPMSGLPAAVHQSSSPGVATVTSAGMVTAQGAGTANISVSITSGTTTHLATGTISVTAPVPGAVTVTTPTLSFAPGTVNIGVGTTVTWQFSGNTHNVTFSGLQPPGGNIPDQPAGSSQSRSFATAGSYPYRCTRHTGMTGTVLVTGSGSPPVFTTLQVSPQSPSVIVGSTVLVDATPLDQNGAALIGLPAPAYQSSDPLVATVSPTGLVTAVNFGSATITVTLTAGLMTHSGTSVVTVVSGGAATIRTPGLTFNPDDVTIHPGETVVWQIVGVAHNITFETIAPPGGNVGDTAPGTAVSRTFTQAGEYKYYCTIHKTQGMNGRVRVQ